METGFTKADNRNLPKVDMFMICNFFASNSDFCDAEFRNVKTSVSARQSYGDDAIGYVQLRRDSDLCTIKCRVGPEHKVRSKSYAATMIVDEKEDKVVSVQCHDCAASTGGCKHSVAFLMWVHRRSEEPSNLSTKIQATRTALQNEFLSQFLQEASNRGVSNCELLNYSNNRTNEIEKFSLHYLILEHCDEIDCGSFLNKLSQYFSEENIKIIEENTRAQHKSKLWHELRYGRVTASKAYEVSKCLTADESLVAVIMGAKTPDTRAMKRGRVLESKVREAVEKKLGKKIKECGLFISPQNPFLAGTPDGICDSEICIEIKCPTSEKTFKNYIKDGKVTQKYMAQLQVQMYVTNLKITYFCVADYNFEDTNDVEVLLVKYDESLLTNYISSMYKF
ncbi:hypothetical protein evm_006807 [Chilo suppressalis]|nr:hypothetical protein evm_006807 [Chilo suppressalis]